MNCLRCGREAEGAFCKVCAAHVREPLRESPYLSTRVLLPERREARKAEEGHSHRWERRPRNPLLLPVILLAALCVGLAALCVCFFFGWLAPL